MQWGNQCADDFPVFLKVPCNFSRRCALRGASVSLCLYVSPHVEASRYTSNHKLCPHHTEPASVSALCCINYASSASNRTCFLLKYFSLHYTEQYATTPSWLLSFSYFWQTDFQRMEALCRTWCDLCLVNTHLWESWFQKNCAGARLHTVSCLWQTLETFSSRKANFLLLRAH